MLLLLLMAATRRSLVSVLESFGTMRVPHTWQWKVKQIIVFKKC